MVVESPEKNYTAATSPSKTFFVNMLTRDINLADALLDLLDNCLDGIVRQQTGATDSDQPFEGYHAKISISSELFEIQDNCGGIPLNVAIESAFAMGARPTEGRDDASSSTIGIYGIGMKRAIFKMGETAIVETNSDHHFDVTIDNKWLFDEKWEELPINMISNDEWKLTTKGTRIEVTDLRPEVAGQFGSDKWLDEFKKEVARHYALIISKGFTVYIGRPDKVKDELEETRIIPEEFLLLENSEINIEPIIYHGEMNDVRFEIYVGLTSQPLDKNEIDKGIGDTTGKYKPNRSGWTIACNDRIVVWQNKTSLTGWGTGGLPSYHNQYTPIAGIVLLTGNTRDLPLTTTKRGIDASSEIYARLLDLMREGTKELTSFTNNYKNAQSRKPIFEKTKPVPLASLKAKNTALTQAHEFSTMRAASVKGTSKYLKPYPKMKKTSTERRISYSVPKPDFENVKEFLSLTEPTPKNIGLHTFNRTLKAAKDFEE